MQVVDSRNGRFQSVRVVIRATGEQHIKELFEALKATGRVHMVV
jgi:putative lipoic acid-binding regulatory protein